MNVGVGAKKLFRRNAEATMGTGQFGMTMAQDGRDTGIGATKTTPFVHYRDEPPRVSQQTLNSSIGCSGIGLHSGRPLGMRLHPAAPGAGIRMRRTDLPNMPEIPATWAYACETPLCTTLADGEVRVATVEHLMAALAAMGIDNALVEIDGPELPIMDGSAAPFIFLVECAGIVEQDAPRRAIRIERPIHVADETRSASLLPAERGLVLDVEIEFDSPLVGRQQRIDTLEHAAFKRDLARARTFGFLSDVDRLRAAGLALGGSLDNAVVIDQDRVLNDGGLRYADELVRHKMLDSIGDLYLAGAPMIGRFCGKRTGHALNLRLLTALFEDDTAWSWTTPSLADLTAPKGDGAIPMNLAVAQRA
jgi:UDP-3-O-[3-hydroxymyristoyl] N-acetylglucosamine deacetylase